MLMAVIEAVISLLFDTLAQISASPHFHITLNVTDRIDALGRAEGGGGTRCIFD